MEPFRDELEAAHARIAQLERELAEARKPPAPPPPQAAAEQAAPEPAAPARVEWWESWPALVLVASAVLYLVMFGATRPDDLFADVTSGDAWFTRGRILLVAVSAACALGDVAIRAVSGRRGAIGRLMLIAAAIAVAPVAIPVAVGLLTIGSVVGGIGTVLYMMAKGIWGIGKWVVKGR